MSRDAKILTGIAVLVVLIFVWFGVRALTSKNEWVCSDGQWKKQGNPSAAMPSTGCGHEVNSFESCVAAGNEIEESDPRQCRTQDNRVFVENSTVPNSTELIRVSNPQPNQMINSPLNVSGEARGQWYFEASFPVRLLDGNGNLVSQGAATAQGDWMTENFVPFTAQLNFIAPATATGTLILQNDNPSGLPANSKELSIPVRFNTASSSAQINVKTYFNNEAMDPEFTCNKVFPVERKISQTPAVAKAALEELLKGPTQEEINKKYFTNINSGVKVNSVKIENGTATADFDEKLQSQVGGSCRVASIRSQITQTLKQFSGVNNVIIAINGRTEDILQP